MFRKERGLSKRAKRKEKQDEAEESMPVKSLDEVEKMIEADETSQAEGALMEHLAENPRNFKAYQLLGILYIKREDYPQAKEVLEEALKRNPEETAIYGPMGKVYFSLGHYSKALQMYQLAHDEDEQNLEYLEHLLMIASRMDRIPLVEVTSEKNTFY